MAPLPASSASASAASVPPDEAGAKAKAKLHALEERLARLEAQGPGLLRVQRHCAAAGVESAVYIWVPADYYDRSMAARAVRVIWWWDDSWTEFGLRKKHAHPRQTPNHTQALLGCFEEQMCKSLLMENVDWQPLPPELGVAEDGELARRANSRCALTDATSFFV